jgi:hypothetical protein
MSTANRKQVPSDHVLRAIVSDFEALAVLVDHAIAELRTNGTARDVDHLQRVKLAAERGGTPARRELSAS